MSSKDKKVWKYDFDHLIEIIEKYEEMSNGEDEMYYLSNNAHFFIYSYMLDNDILDIYTIMEEANVRNFGVLEEKFNLIPGKEYYKYKDGIVSDIPEDEIQKLIDYHIEIAKAIVAHKEGKEHNMKLEFFALEEDAEKQYGEKAPTNSLHEDQCFAEEQSVFIKQSFRMIYLILTGKLEE